MAFTFSPRWRTHERTCALRTMPEHASVGINPAQEVCKGSHRPLRSIAPLFATGFGQIGFSGRCEACEETAIYKPRLSKWILSNS